MLNQPTIEKLHAMKLYGMADAFREQLQTADSSQLSFEEPSGCWSITSGPGRKDGR